MTARRPWTIDSLDESTRGAAAAAARRSGLSLGAWLNAVVADRTAGLSERHSRTRPSFRAFDDGRSRPESEDDVSALFDALGDLAERVQSAEDEAHRALDVAERRIAEASQLPRGRTGRLAAAERQLEAAQADLFAAEEDARRTYRRVADHARDLASSTGFATDPRIDSITQAVTQLGRRLEDVARRLEAQSQAPAAGQRTNDADLLTAIRSRLDALSERIDSPREDRVETTLKTLESRISDLASRIETMPATTPTSVREEALARIEGQLSNLSSTVRKRRPDDSRPATFQDQLEWDRDAATGDTDLADAIRQIAERQKALEGQFDPKPYVETIDERFRSFTDDISARIDAASERRSLDALQAQIHSLSEQLAQSRHAAVDREQLAHLQRQIVSLREAIEGAVSKTSLAAVVEEVRALGEKIEKLRQAGMQSSDLQRIEAEIREIRRAVENAVPRESFAAIESKMAAITRRLDMPATQLDAVAIERIEHEITQLQRSVADAMPAESLHTLAAETRRLSSAIESIAARTDVAAIEALRRDIVDLRAQLDAPDFTQRLVADIRAQIGDRTLALRPSSEAVSSIEQQIDALAAKIEGTRTGDPDARQLAALEAQVARLTESLGRTRSDTLDAVRTAIGEKVDVSEPVHGSIIRTLQQSLVDLKTSSEASERRSQDLLLTVHDTLKKVVDRLADLEGDRAHPASAPQPAAAMPGAALPRVDSAAFATQTLPPSPPLKDMKSAVEAARAAAARATQLKAAPDDRLAADLPLEPGSGRPTITKSTGETIRAAREQIKSSETQNGEEVRQSFIAAARRAAQAAASGMTGRRGGMKTAETKEVDVAKPAEAPQVEVEGHNGLFARFTGRLKPQRKTLILAMAAIAIIIAALQVATLFTGNDTETASTSPTVTRTEALAGSGTGPALPDGARASFTTASAPPQDVTTFSISNDRARDTASAPADAPAANPTRLPPLPDGIAAPRLRAAIQAGDPRAFFEVGARLTEGRGVPRDLAAAVAWYRAGAERGHPPSLYRLGNMLERGQGVERDVREAVRLYQRAANAGNRKAMHNLAALFASGAEGRPDYDRAFPLFLQAAELGLVDSQYNLAVLYVNGLGTRPNPAEAYTWFAIAAQNGDREAVAKRDEVGARLDGQALVNARLAAQSFRPRAIEPAANEESAPAGTWDEPGGRTSQAPPARPDLGIQVGASAQRRG